MFLGRFFHEDRLKDGDVIVKETHKKRVSCGPPSFSSPDRGKSLPRPHKAHIGANRVEPRQILKTPFSLETCAGKT